MPRAHPVVRRYRCQHAAADPTRQDAAHSGALQASRVSVLTMTSTLIGSMAQYGLFLVLAGAVLAWWRAPSHRQRISMAIAGLVALAVTMIAIKVTSLAWSDPRPFVVDGRAPLFAHPPDNGFPSDHTAVGSAVAATVLAFRRRLGLALLAVAVLVGMARVAAHVHHVPDILAGIVIGLVAAATGHLLADRPAAQRTSRRGAGWLARRSRPPRRWLRAGGRRTDR
jgi:undecaprenyl-diphosphatase